MGKVDFFSIILAKPDGIYFSGEALSGVIKIRVIERLKVNAIFMLVSGGARVHWTEQHSNGKSSHTVSYSANESYLRFNVVFLEKNPNIDLYLEPGDYSYPFNIVLPPNLPTSFEHQFGQVRYSLNGTIDIPWAIDKHTVRSFSVISHLNLNLNPSLRQSYGVSGQKVLCCGPCKSEPIIATFTIQKGGYVPGEGILFSVIIENKSNREVKEMTVNLVQMINFHASRKTRQSRRNVNAIEFPKIIPGRHTERYENAVLVIPPVCSSSNKTCRIIDVTYTLLFNFDASGLAVSTDLAIPVVIGTIPLSMNAQVAPVQIPFSYQADMFGPNKVQIPSENTGKGEMIESDSNTFKPFYPYYQDFTMNKGIVIHEMGCECGIVKAIIQGLQEGLESANKLKELLKPALKLK